MPHSPDFHTFTTHLHSNLRNRLLGSTAIEIEPGSKMGSGLLNTRMDNNDKLFRPRLIGVSGRLAQAVGRILQRDVPDDLFVVGATRDDDPAAIIDRLFAFCPGVAQNILGVMERTVIGSSTTTRLSCSTTRPSSSNPRN